MPHFTKKPVTIEAIQFLGREEGFPQFDVPLARDIPEWMTDSLNAVTGSPGSSRLERRDGFPSKSDPLGQDTYDVLVIVTLEGEHAAMPRDWIIRGVKGELYPCKPDIFEATYTAAGERVGYADMLPGDMLAAVGVDGMKWTEAFMDIACYANPLGRALRAFPHGDRSPLFGTMLGWFCNTIEAGRAAGEQAIRRKAYPLFSEAVICEPIVGETHLTIRYQSTQDAHAAHRALTELAQEVGIMGEVVATEGEARERMADSFAEDFDQAKLDASFAKGAGDNARSMGLDQGRTHEPTSAIDDEEVVIGWCGGVRVIPDEHRAADVALAFIVKHKVSCAEATSNDGVYEEAPLLVEALADAVGYYRDPEEA